MTHLRLSLREIRLILERLAQVAGTPEGLLLSVRDCAVYSAILPTGGFAGLDQQFRLLKDSVPEPLQMLANGTDIAVDCRGQHAWLVAETVLDLAIDQYRLTGRREIRARNVPNASELRVASGLAERQGSHAEVEIHGEETRLLVSPRPCGGLSRLDRLRIEGISVASEIWWPLYHASHEALAPDSFESRRHAGTIRVEADGRIVGRNEEDETDLSLLVADPSRFANAPRL